MIDPLAARNAAVEEARRLLRQSKYAVALTGAGISTPSGIPDFRSATGLWAAVDPMEVASLRAFRRSPERFYRWLRPLAELTLNALPNAAHKALAQLEAAGRLRAVITQNIDQLHTLAGSHNIHEIHGHIRQVTCIACHFRDDATAYLKQFIADETVPHCPRCGAALKPSVVLFGEELPLRPFYDAQHAAAECDLMLVIGSSLEVYPAASLPLIAKDNRARLIIVNDEPTPHDRIADIILRGDVVELLPSLIPSLPDRRSEK